MANWKRTLKPRIQCSSAFPRFVCTLAKAKLPSSQMLPIYDLFMLNLLNLVWSFSSVGLYFFFRCVNSRQHISHRITSNPWRLRVIRHLFMSFTLLQINSFPVIYTSVCDVIHFSNRDTVYYLFIFFQLSCSLGTTEPSLQCTHTADLVQW